MIEAGVDGVAGPVSGAPMEARARARSEPATADPTGATARLQPAFLLSGERSGSTLLRWLLDAHPEIASPGELRLGRLAWDLYLTLSRTVTVDVPEEGGARARATLHELRGVIDGIVERYARARGKRVWCEKSPDNLAYLDALANAYPDARYVCLYRDCRDVVRSCLEVSRNGFMTELADYARRRPENLVQAMAESWADKTGALLRFELRNPTLCHRLRYEDLVTAPDHALAGVFAFLGVAPAGDVAASAFALPHDAGGGDVRIHRTTGIETTRVGAGRDLPTERIGSALRARVNALSRRLGYADL